MWYGTGSCTHTDNLLTVCSIFIGPADCCSTGRLPSSLRAARAVRVARNRKDMCFDHTSRRRYPSATASRERETPAACLTITPLPPLPGSVRFLTFFFYSRLRRQQVLTAITQPIVYGIGISPVPDPTQTSHGNTAGVCCYSARGANGSRSTRLTIHPSVQFHSSLSRSLVLI